MKKPCNSRITWLSAGVAALAAAALGWLLCAPVEAAALKGSESLTATITPQDIWAPAAVTDLAASSGAEGQILLQWTAPDGNASQVAEQVAAAGYLVRIATYSADSVGSTTTWWNAATAVAATPVPGAPGMLEMKLLLSLEPGATYYAAVVSSDAAGNYSPIDDKTATPGAQAHVAVYDATPPAPANLRVTAVSNSSITIQWDASAAADLDFYRIYVDSTDPFDFADAFILMADSDTTSFEHTGLTAGSTYYYRVTAVDKGAPTFAGLAKESAASNTVAGTPGASGKVPGAPFGIDIERLDVHTHAQSTGIPVAAATESVKISWMPVRNYQNGDLFGDVAHPQSFELSSYKVYRATAPVKAPWSLVATLSSGTLTWTDHDSLPEYYYYVRAANPSGNSHASMVRAVTGQAWIIGYDFYSWMMVPGWMLEWAMGDRVNPDTAYLLETSSHTDEVGGRVFKAIEFGAWKGGTKYESGREFAGMADLYLHYEQGAGGLVTVSGLPDMSAKPENLSAFWFNGIKWVQLYGKVDTLTHAVRFSSKYMGKYQLRAVEHAGGFNFNPAGVSNRSFTPNGDGKNDTVVFIFDNPRDSSVTGKVYDLKGQFVSPMMQGPISNSLQWDGSSGGRTVPGGIYIYQLEAEGRTFNGTILLVK